MTDDTQLQPESEDLEGQDFDFQESEQETEEQQTDSELAPEQKDAEVEAKDGEEVEEKDPAGYTKAINKKHFQMMEEKRRADALEAQIHKLQSQMPQEQRPEIPSPPDPYDDNYAEKLRERDAIVRQVVEYDTQQALAQQQQRFQEQQRIQAQQKAVNESVKTYSGRATELGIKPEDLQAAGNAVAAYGITDDLTQHILNDEKGPLITTYLSLHPDEVERLVGMTPTQQGAYLATAIAPKISPASGITNTPKPPESLGGGGAPPKQDGAEGVTYE